MASDFDVRSQAVITEVDGVPSGGTIQSEIPLIAGKADPFATIDVHDGATLLGVVSANGEGNWMLQLSTPLLDGIHDLSAVQVAEYGVRSTTSYFAVTVEASDAARTTPTAFWWPPPRARRRTSACGRWKKRRMGFALPRLI